MNTLDALKSLIHESFEIDPSTIDENAPLTDYGLDSLSLAELLFNVEDRFHISFPEDRTDINTLAGLAQLIDEIKAHSV